MDTRYLFADEEKVDVSKEVNVIWSIANRLDAKPLYDSILASLKAHESDTLYMSPSAFASILKEALGGRGHR